MQSENKKSLESDFSKIKPFATRKFVPDEMDFTDVNAVKGLFDLLLGREINSVMELEAWLDDLSELGAVYGQFSSVLYIRMTSQTDDAERANAYQHFTTQISPEVKPLWDKIDRKFIKVIEKYPLDEKKYSVYIRNVKSDIELFREKNVHISTEISLLSQKYQTICGAMTVEYNGQEMTMPQMRKFQYENDRAVREEAWRLTSARYLQDSEQLEDIFDEMMRLRSKLSKNAGLADFVEYSFNKYHRFDYTPADCKNFHQAVKEHVVPVLKRFRKKRQQQLGVDSLRSWDTACDPLGRDVLKPFNEVKDFISGVGRMFKKLDPELSGYYDTMANMGLLDLASRKGKAPGGYQSTLSEARKPFIFMNAVGVDDDLRVLLHEAGHAFHSFLASHHSLLSYRHAPMEFCEVASMSMELLASPYLSEFYGEEEANRSRLSHLEMILSLLAWIANIDAYQHWLYSNPSHSRDERKNAWRELYNSFAGVGLDYSGFDNELDYMWQKQIHLYSYPFYYIEYGIAQLGALQIWKNSKENPAQALTAYKKALALGGSVPLPELFDAANAKFDFSASTVKPLMEMILNEIEA